MDCSDQEGHSKSKEIFSRAKTYQEFLNLWSKFYSNEICIPTYFSVFIGAEDNKHATKKMGQKFQEITEHGVIPTNFQTNNLKDGQKAYVNLLATEEVADAITIYINRYPGFVAFYQDTTGESCVTGLFITYDPTKEQTKKTMKTGVFFGDPFTHLGIKSDDINFIQEWLNPSMKNVISNENFKEVTIIDAIPTEKADRILDLLLNALRDNSELTASEINRLNNM